MPNIPAPPVGEKFPQPIDSSIANNAGGEIPVVAAPPQSNWQIKDAENRAEYVSGSGFLWLANYIRSLPHFIDDITRDLGIDTYDRMMTDAQVNSCIRILAIKIIEDGIELDPAIKAEAGGTPANQGEEITSDLSSKEAASINQSDQDHQNDAEMSAQITEWCQKVLDNMERPLMAILYEMVTASLIGGNKVAEQIWELRIDDDSKQRLHLKNLKTKPRETTAFVVDAYMNLLGLLAMIPGQGWPIQTGTIVGDPRQQPNMLPKEKFFILTWNGKASDPRGTSLLRAIYTSWYLKVQTWGEYGKYLAQFASGIVVGFTHPNAQPMPQTDSQGNPVPGGAFVKPADLMLRAIEELRNGAAAVFENGADCKVFPPQGDGNQIFNAAITLFNQEIAHGVLCQALATEVAPQQTKAATSSQTNVLDEVIVQERMNLAKAIQSQILYRMVLYNWGRDIADRMTPKVRAVQTEARSWATDAAAIGTLVTSKFLDPSQYPELDALLGLPPRDPAVTAAAIQANLATLQQQAQTGQALGKGGGSKDGQPPSDATPGGVGGLGVPTGLAGGPSADDQSGANYPDPWADDGSSPDNGQQSLFADFPISR